jgi:hypothetical protein
MLPSQTQVFLLSDIFATPQPYQRLGLISRLARQKERHYLDGASDPKHLARSARYSVGSSLSWNFYRGSPTERLTGAFRPEIRAGRLYTLFLVESSFQKTLMNKSSDRPSTSTVPVRRSLYRRPAVPHFPGAVPKSNSRKSPIRTESTWAGMPPRWNFPVAPRAVMTMCSGTRLPCFSRNG